MCTQEINSREREASLRKTGNTILPMDLTQKHTLINRNTKAHTNKNTSHKQTNKGSKQDQTNLPAWMSKSQDHGQEKANVFPVSQDAQKLDSPT